MKEVLEIIGLICFFGSALYIAGLVLWAITILAISLCYRYWPAKMVVVYLRNNETGKVEKIKISEKIADRLWGENGKRGGD